MNVDFITGNFWVAGWNSNLSRLKLDRALFSSASWASNSTPSVNDAGDVPRFHRPQFFGWSLVAARITGKHFTYVSCVSTVWASPRAYSEQRVKQPGDNSRDKEHNEYPELESGWETPSESTFHTVQNYHTPHKAIKVESSSYHPALSDHSNRSSATWASNFSSAINDVPMPSDNSFFNKSSVATGFANKYFTYTFCPPTAGAPPKVDLEQTVEKTRNDSENKEYSEYPQFKPRCETTCEIALHTVPNYHAPDLDTGSLSFKALEAE